MRLTVLVIAAHPDDETIGAAGLLLRARAAAVVHLTDGAPREPALRPTGPADRREYARVRRAEALAALAEARLGPRDVRALWAVDQEAVREIAPLARTVAATLRELEPRIVVAHPYEGGHPDHDAAALVARAAIALVARDGRAPRLLEMTSYHRRDGALRTGEFLPGGPPAVARALTPEERAAKRRMLDRYATQRAVLAAFTEDGVERFRPAAPLDGTRRPHEGPLHYESLGWTTFEAFRAVALRQLAALDLGEGAWR